MQRFVSRWGPDDPEPEEACCRRGWRRSTLYVRHAVDMSGRCARFAFVRGDEGDETDGERVPDEGRDDLLGPGTDKVDLLEGDRPVDRPWSVGDERQAEIPRRSERRGVGACVVDG